VSAKRYRQWCGLAQALDRVGGRWTILIVRELLTGPKRYSDLRANLPGIATNLLAARLRDLEDAGILARTELPPPTPVVVYELTEEGWALKESVLALIRWGGRFLPAAAQDDAFRGTWLALALEAVLAPRVVGNPDVVLTVRVEADGAVVWLMIGEGSIATGVGELQAFDVELTGDPRLILALATGHLPAEEARSRGLAIEGPVGSRRAFARFTA
jgi:DNA-binding HxlR family transcriptional regulator